MTRANGATPRTDICTFPGSDEMNETTGERGSRRSGAARWRLGLALLAWAGGAGWLWAPGSITAQEERSARALARNFRSEDGERVMRALVAFQRMPMEERSLELRQALVDALVQETRGPRVLAGTEQFASLAGTVLELGKACDPVALPAIVLFPMYGVGVYETVFRFGPLGLDAVLREMSRVDVESNVYRGGSKRSRTLRTNWELPRWTKPRTRRWSSTHAELSSSHTFVATAGS